MKGVEVSEDGKFLWVRKKDSKRSVVRYSRELEVCPSINGDGVVLSVVVNSFGREAQSAAGLILSAKQARRVIKHMQQILDGLEEG